MIRHLNGSSNKVINLNSNKLILRKSGRIASTLQPTSTSISTSTSSLPQFSFSPIRFNSTTTTTSQTQIKSKSHSSVSDHEKPETGPIARYSDLVEKGRLRDDPFQRSIIQKLQNLHDELKGYQQKLPKKEDVQVKVKEGLVSRSKRKG